MVENSPSRHRRPPCKTTKKMRDEAASVAALINPSINVQNLHSHYVTDHKSNNC